MVRHLIYIYKVPDSPKRVGYVYSSTEPIRSKNIPKILMRLCLGYPLAIHRITTEEMSTDSIVAKDAFFDHIEFCKTPEDFKARLEALVASR